MTAAGAVSEFTAFKRLQVALAFAQKAGVDVSAVELSISPGSVVITAKILTASATAASALSTTLGATLATPELATNFFAGVTGGVSVVSIPSVRTVSDAVVAYPPPPAPAPGNGTSSTSKGMSGGAIAGIAIGALLGSAFIACFLVSSGMPKRKPDADELDGPSLTLTDLSNQNAEV